MEALTLTHSERELLGDAIIAFGVTRGRQMMTQPLEQAAADEAVDAAFEKVLGLLYPGDDHEIKSCPTCGHITGTVPEPITPVAYLPRAMLPADTCATPDCPATEDLKQDGDGSYCEDHR